MSAIFIDGFDYITSGNITLKWDNNPSVTINSPGTFGKGKSLTTAGGANLTKTLSANYTTAMMGFHFLPNSLSAVTMCSFADANSFQTELKMDTTGALFFSRNGTQIGTDSFTNAGFRNPALQVVWYELQVTIDNSVGVAKLYAAGNQVLNGTGLDTQNTGNAFFNQIRLHGNNGASTYDNFHLWDTTAGVDISAYPYGEHVIDSQLANAVGTNSAWTKGGTINTNNYQQVNEANEDGDTTYVYSLTPNAIDSYGFASLTESSGTVGVVAVNTIARIDDAPATHHYQHYTKSGGSTATSANIQPGASYKNLQTFFGTDPATGVAWTISGRNGAEFGYKEID